MKTVAHIFVRGLVLAGALVVASSLVALPACSEKSATAACNKFNSLCAADAGDGGLQGKVQCDPKKLDDNENADDAKDCIEKATTCDEALSCYTTAGVDGL